MIALLLAAFQLCVFCALTQPSTPPRCTLHLDDFVIVGQVVRVIMAAPRMAHVAHDRRKYRDSDSDFTADGSRCVIQCDKIDS